MANPHPIHRILRDAHKASRANGPMAGLHLLDEAAVRQVADALAVAGFRDGKLIAYGSEAVILEVGEKQALRYVMPHPGEPVRARDVDAVIYQPVRRRTGISHGFYEVFYKEPFSDLNGNEHPYDHPDWPHMQKAQAAYAQTGTICYDGADANFIMMQTPEGPRMLIGDPGNRLMTAESDPDFFTLLLPNVLQDFDPDYRYAGSDGIWYQKKAFPNIVTGRPFDRAYPGTGRIAGVLSDAELDEIRATGEIAVWRADGSCFTPPLPDDSAARASFVSRFLERVRQGEYPLPVLSALLEEIGQRLPPLKEGPAEPQGFAQRYGMRKAPCETSPLLS